MNAKERNDKKIKIKKRLYDCRKAKNLTLDQLGAYIGYGKSSISKWENPNEPSLPEIDVFAQLASLYGTSVDTLLGIEDPGYYTKAGKTIAQPYGLTEKSLYVLKYLVDPCDPNTKDIEAKNLFVLNFILESIYDQVIKNTREQAKWDNLPIEKKYEGWLEVDDAYPIMTLLSKIYDYIASDWFSVNKESFAHISLCHEKYEGVDEILPASQLILPHFRDEIIEELDRLRKLYREKLYALSSEKDPEGEKDSKEKKKNQNTPRLKKEPKSIRIKHPGKGGDQLE